jgi:3-isopropylmalate/(R)-2-methylmalate dehydratase small subunit
MEPLVRLSGVAAVLMINNIDTDQIIPGKDLMKVEKSGFGGSLFGNWRFRADGAEDPDFVLNREPFRRAVILVAGENFGCGSSRASAVWALRDFGVKCVIAPSFGSIFAANCFGSGVLPLSLPGTQVQAIAHEIEAGRYEVTVDLESCEVADARGEPMIFKVPQLGREMLLTGKDPIAVTLSRDAKIQAFQDADRIRRPWVYDITERSEQAA